MICQKIRLFRNHVLYQNLVLYPNLFLNLVQRKPLLVAY
jgi:hypothetical protein